MMRKATAILLALCVALPAFTGCQFGKLRKEKTGATLQIDLTKSYRSEQVAVGEEGFPLLSVGNRVFYEYYDASKNLASIHYLDAETGETAPLELAYQKDAQAGRQVRPDAIVMLPDEKLGVVFNNYKLGHNYRPTDVQRVVEVYDAELQYLELIEIPEDVADAAPLGNESVIVDKDGNWFCEYQDSSGNPILAAYDKNFRKYGTFLIPMDMSIHSLFVTADGTACASLIGHDAAGAINKVVGLDAKSRSLRDIFNIPNAENLRGFCTGTNGYDFYYYNDDKLFGVKENSEEEVINWTNSDFCDGIHVCRSLESGQFLTYPFMMDGGQQMWLLEERSAEEIEHMQIISLATLELNYSLEQAVVDFNRSSSDYRIFIKDYADYNEKRYDSTTGGMQKFKEDMLSGVIADIICADNLNFESLASKGLFEDWYDVMKQDEEFHKDEYLTNFFTSYQSGDKLLRLGMSFHVLTSVAKSRYISEQGITPSELMALSETLPEGMELYQVHQKDIMVSNYLRGMQNAYIDRDKAVSYFDTPEFRELLTFFASLPDGYRSNLTESCYLEDKVLLYNTSFDNPLDYHALSRTTFKDEEFTLVGYPMRDDVGNGGIFGTDYTLSLNANSKQQEGVWRFVRFLLSEDYQKKISSMPISMSALEYRFDLATKQTMAKEFFNGVEVNIGAATEEEMMELMEYIKGIQTSYYFDETVYNILMEETEMLLAGDCTVEQAAKMMQSRVSLYLSEQS